MYNCHVRLQVRVAVIGPIGMRLAQHVDRLINHTWTVEFPTLQPPSCSGQRRDNIGGSRDFQDFYFYYFFGFFVFLFELEPSGCFHIKDGKLFFFFVFFFCNYILLHKKELNIVSLSFPGFIAVSFPVCCRFDFCSPYPYYVLFLLSFVFPFLSFQFSII